MSTNIASFMMFCGVFRDCHNLKIFNPVVKLVTIDMVDCFVRVERATDLFFHDKAMHENGLTIISDYFITSVINTYRTGESSYSFKASIHPQPLVVFLTKSFAKSWFATAFNFARDIFDAIRTPDKIGAAILALQCIMVLAKTFCELGFATALNFTGKIFDAIRTTQREFSVFAQFIIMFLAKTSAENGFFTILNRTDKILFHDNNLTLLGGYVKQNIGG